MLEYHAAYFKIEDGWYMAQVLDFPGVVTQGRTLNSARRMVRDTLRDMAEWYMEDGKPLPRPNSKASAKRAAFRERIRLRVQLQAGARS